MCIYGATTKRDLTSVGSLLFMALIGLILASVLNIFWHSSGLVQPAVKVVRGDWQIPCGLAGRGVPVLASVRLRLAVLHASGAVFVH